MRLYPCGQVSWPSHDNGWMSICWLVSKSCNAFANKWTASYMSAVSALMTLSFWWATNWVDFLTVFSSDCDHSVTALRTIWLSGSTNRNAVIFVPEYLNCSKSSVWRSCRMKNEFVKPSIPNRNPRNLPMKWSNSCDNHSSFRFVAIALEHRRFYRCCNRAQCAPPQNS